MMPSNVMIKATAYDLVAARKYESDCVSNATLNDFKIITSRKPVDYICNSRGTGQLQPTQAPTKQSRIFATYLTGRGSGLQNEVED